MNEEFDKRLTDRIKEVFDNTGDSAANDGWLLLREKYPATPGRRPLAWLWWGMAAAVVLLGIVTTVWLIQPNQKLPNNVGRTKTNPAKVKAPGTSAQTSVAKSAENKHIIARDEQTTQGDNSSENNSIADDNKKRTVTPDKMVSGRTVARAQNKVKPPALKIVTNSNDSNASNRGIVNSNGQNEERDRSDIVTVTQAAKNTNHTSNNLTVDNSLTSKAGIPVISPSTIADMTKAKPAATVAKTNPTNKEEILKTNTAAKVSPKVVFGVYVSAFSNYLIGDGNAYFNMGIGGSADIMLTGNLKLSTGLAIFQNSFNYDRIPTTGSSLLQSNTFNSPPAGLAIITYYLVSVHNTWNTKLVALDIPLNLKYQFGKHKAYIYSGFSSGTFLSEQYVLNTTYTPTTAALTDNATTTQKYLNSFYLFKTINLGFGLGHRFTKKGSLYVEPFFKIPLAGAGYQDLKFGSGGINLKFSFETPNP